MLRSNSPRSDLERDAKRIQSAPHTDPERADVLAGIAAPLLEGDFGRRALRKALDTREALGTRLTQRERAIIAESLDRPREIKRASSGRASPELDVRQRLRAELDEARIGDLTRALSTLQSEQVAMLIEVYGASLKGGAVPPRSALPALLTGAEAFSEVDPKFSIYLARSVRDRLTSGTSKLDVRDKALVERASAIERRAWLIAAKLSVQILDGQRASGYSVRIPEDVPRASRPYVEERLRFAHDATTAVRTLITEVHFDACERNDAMTPETRRLMADAALRAAIDLAREAVRTMRASIDQAVDRGPDHARAVELSWMWGDGRKYLQDLRELADPVLDKALAAELARIESLRPIFAELGPSQGPLGGAIERLAFYEQAFRQVSDLHNLAEITERAESGGLPTIDREIVEQLFTLADRYLELGGLAVAGRLLEILKATSALLYIFTLRRDVPDAKPLKDRVASLESRFERAKSDVKARADLEHIAQLRLQDQVYQLQLQADGRPVRPEIRGALVEAVRAHITSSLASVRRAAGDDIGWAEHQAALTDAFWMARGLRALTADERATLDPESTALRLATEVLEIDAARWGKILADIEGELEPLRRMMAEDAGEVCARAHHRFRELDAMRFRTSDNDPHGNLQRRARALAESFEALAREALANSLPKPFELPRAAS
jgi:hypothetical protein